MGSIPTGNLIGSFQRTVNLFNPIGVEGDFASRNPRATALTPNGGAFVAGPNGVLIGNFAWIASDGFTVNSYATGAVPPTGYVHRDQQGLLTEYLQAAGMLIPPGFPVTIMVAGDFLDLIAGGTAAVAGSQCYARYADGALFTGSAPAGATGTGSIGSTSTAAISSTTSVALSAVTGLISDGDTIAGTGIPAGTTILSGATANNGGAGTYVLSAAVDITVSETVTTFGNVLDVTAVTGTFAVGDAVTGTGIPANATLASQVSGAIGGVGVYTLDIPATAYAASTALTIVGGILTPFVAKSAANVGQLVQISTW
ncbi:MAG: gp53 minor capsid family protein [Sulfobacillus sp.]